MACAYEIPKWAAKPPSGLHLDVMKDDKLVQKLLIDEQTSYLFGRSPQGVDICIDHASCSRFHAVLVYHQHLERTFLVDLGSTHGTYIGSLRIEANKPTQLPIDSVFHFGASTRQYVIRQRPPLRPVMEELESSTSNSEGTPLGLPETDAELNNLTEFNTARNCRTSLLGISEEDIIFKNGQSKNKSVTFNDEEEIINPEDVDPSIGRFRNLVKSTLIPSASKRPKLGTGLVPIQNQEFRYVYPRLAKFDDIYSGVADSHGPFFTPLSLKWLPLPNPAPDIEETGNELYLPFTTSAVKASTETVDEPEPTKKKYTKEAWPGKKHGSVNLLV